MRMPASTNSTAATTPADPPHLTLSNDTPTRHHLFAPLKQRYGAILISSAHLRLELPTRGAGCLYSPKIREGIPTFMCVVQVHTLDGACTDRGWLEKARLTMVLEELPLGPYGGSDR